MQCVVVWLTRSRGRDDDVLFQTVCWLQGLTGRELTGCIPVAYTVAGCLGRHMSRVGMSVHGRRRVSGLLCLKW